MLIEQDKTITDDASVLECSEGQRVVLSCNNSSSRCPSLDSSELCEEAKERILELVSYLRKILRRLKSEGYELKDGKIIKPKKHERV